MTLTLTHRYQSELPDADPSTRVAHLRQLLAEFLTRGDCSRFQIGITDDLERRRRALEQGATGFTLMCVIDRADRFRKLPGAGDDRAWLYVLLDRRDLAS
ncbi:MAG: hypothetical protein IPM29_05580 [Planctomycetes bacterium]|nr:hypothetical protein [Planctomycetota bacterium]